MRRRYVIAALSAVTLCALLISYWVMDWRSYYRRTGSAASIMKVPNMPSEMASFSATGSVAFILQRPPNLICKLQIAGRMEESALMAFARANYPLDVNAMIYANGVAVQERVRHIGGRIAEDWSLNGEVIGMSGRVGQRVDLVLFYNKSTKQFVGQIIVRSGA